MVFMPAIITRLLPASHEETFCPPGAYLDEERMKMCLKEALEKIVSDRQAVVLKDSRREWEAAELLTGLSAGMLKRPVHMLSGVYIAALTESGLMGEVLYRMRAKA
jgi:hypothetical protein